MVLSLRITGIHYGLTLLYSYLLPVINVVETSYGFVFGYATGAAKGLTCVFRESTLETECYASNRVDPQVVENVLGLSKWGLFRGLCGYSTRDCVVSNITLIYEPRYRVHVAYSVYLSRNTDYYANTIRWVREALVKGVVESPSYIAREFNSVRRTIDKVLRGRSSPLREALKLLEVRGFGVKLAKAYLLHAHGMTEHAPVDRHYAKILNLKRVNPPKTHCIKQRLDCTKCDKHCPYAYTTKRFSSLNGVVQSLAYIYGKLSSKRRTALEEILVRDPHQHLDKLENTLYSLTANPEAGKNKALNSELDIWSDEA